MVQNKLHFLSKIADVLTKEVNTSELNDELKSVLSGFDGFRDISLYVFDSVTSTMRDCVNSWSILEDDSDVYKSFATIKGYDFVINSKAYKLPAVISDITLKISTLCMPIVKDSKDFGIMVLEFEENTPVNMEFLFLMKIFSSQVSLKLQNIVLNEQSKINVEFHDSMKNIAKIIETQYELNYIVPIIGEMLDRFITDHLIYVFLKWENEFKLVWPKACNDDRIFDVLSQLTPETEYILSNNDKIGAFPLMSEEGEVIGCIVARSTLEALSKRDIGYLEQL